jgi:addiction module HigA family antidote
MVPNAEDRYPYEPDYAVAPGEILLEHIEALGMTQKELAVRTGLSPKTINLIIRGQEPVTYETAIKLERATGTVASLWNNLEKNYRQQLVRLADRSRLAADIAWLDTIPVGELVKRGVIARTSSASSRLEAVLGFFGVSSVAAWNHLWLDPKVAARRSRCFESEPGATATWLRLGELQAQNVESKPYDRAGFCTALSRIRQLTTEAAGKFAPEMQRLCSETGVALVFVPEVKGAPWHGASWWPTAEKAVIELSLRYKWEDQFWFSFFHEAGHILNDSKKDTFINNGKDEDPREKNANQFAADYLIPPEQAWRIKRLRSYDQLMALARELGISPSIVAGRFQRETGKWDYFNRIRRKLAWVES